MGVGFIAKMVAIIVKSAVNSKVGSELGKELIGTSIDGVSERSITEINNFISGKKSKLEHILSEEKMKEIYVAEENIDFVIAELKDLLSEVEITDGLFRECRYNPEKLKDILWNEYRRDKDIIENESDVEKGLDIVAETLIELVLESEEFEKDLIIHISNTVEDANIEIKKISDFMYKNYGSMNEEIQMILVIVQMILEQIQKKDSKENDIEREEKFKNNKKQDYIDNWNSILFLHQNNGELPITLADAFIKPNFEIIHSVKRIGFSTEDIWDNIIEKFIQYTRTSTMLITGVPGMGKTTITSWLANKYETDDNVIILRFRDWERKELKQGLLKAIYESLECKKKDLENRVLILDGFDEIKALDIRDKVLGEFVSELKDFENLKCIITSRPAYIDAYYFQNVIELYEFDIGKVEGFYKNITGEILYNKGKIESNLEVLGIPVILYMAIMSNVDISENPSKPELYNRLFAEIGGIFDKFFDGETQYGFGDQILRKPENARKYLEFLSDTAFRMFEKGELQLKRNECSNIKLKFKKKEVSILEFPIKHLFEDTANNIEFVHKSIYEYFVSEYIFEGIDSTMEKNNSKEELAGVLGGALKRNSLSDEMLEFLEYKIRNGANNKFNIVNETFQLMLRDGMTYYTGECYKNVIDCEMYVFANMLDLMHLWGKRRFKFNNSITRYLNCGSILKINLVNADLVGVNLSGANLSNANLLGVHILGEDSE